MPCNTLKSRANQPGQYTPQMGYGGTAAAQPGMQYPTPHMPTGYPTGGTATPLVPSAGGYPAAPISEMPPSTVQSTMYIPGFLKSQIGRLVRVQFLMGTGTLVDRTGTLVGVGASYILLKLIESDDVMLCDMYSIKFVDFIR